NSAYSGMLRQFVDDEFDEGAHLGRHMPARGIYRVDVGSKHRPVVEHGTQPALGQGSPNVGQRNQAEPKAVPYRGAHGEAGVDTITAPDGDPYALSGTLEHPLVGMARQAEANAVMRLQLFRTSRHAMLFEIRRSPTQHVGQQREPARNQVGVFEAVAA